MVFSRRRSSFVCRWATRSSVAFFVLCNLIVFCAEAAQFKLGDASLTVKGAVTIGTGIRTSDRNEEVLNIGSARSIGANGLAAGGTNSGDGNLNYQRGDIYSTVLKGVISADIKYKNVGLFASGRAWTDYTQSNSAVYFGNFPNGYSPNSRLSDDGFSHRAKFSGIDYGENYVYVSADLLGTMKVGLLNMRWGTPSTIRNSVSNIDPRDFSALNRPGALPSEVLIPFPAVSLKRNFGSKITVEAFYEFGFQHDELAGCGEYLSIVDFRGQKSCNKAFIGGPGTLTDAQRITQGFYWNREDEVMPNDQGEYGIGLGIRSDTLKTAFGLIFANYHSRSAVIDSRTSARAGNIQFIPGNPDGLNGTYLEEYVPDLHVGAANFTTSLKNALNIRGQVVYTSNLPLQYNLAETSAASAAPLGTPNIFLASKRAAVAKGQIWEMWERYGQVEASLSVDKTFKAVVGAERLTLGAEFGIKNIPNLPGHDVMRFGRPDVYGLGPISGVACDPSTKACSTDGFVTSNAYGYRLQGSMKYKDVLTGLDIIPSVLFGHDVRGYSADNQFIEGRQFVRLNLLAEYKKNYYVELLYSPQWGGDYSIAKDRSYATATMGVRF